MLAAIQLNGLKEMRKEEEKQRQAARNRSDQGLVLFAGSKGTIDARSCSCENTSQS